MIPFSSSAAIYDALYSEKAYEQEIEGVLTLSNSHGLDPKSVISFGCGTGRYETIIALKGIRTFGVDISSEMISFANKRKDSLPSNLQELLKFEVGDFSNISINSEFDLAISLFHVVNYISSSEKLLSAFQSTAQALRKDGLFIFDTWHGPGIEKDPPTVRRKEVSFSDGKVSRVATPIHDKENHEISITYDYTVQNSSGSSSFSEIHRMRYLYPKEIEDYLGEAGFNKIYSYSNFSGASLDDTSWNAVYIAMKGEKQR